MSKTLKKSIMIIIIALGLLILFQTNVSAVNIDSAEALKEAFKDQNVEIDGTTITLKGDAELKNPDWAEGSEDEKYDVVELSGADYVLNLGNYILTAYEINIIDGSLTVNFEYWGGTIKTDSEYGAINIFPDAKMEVNNGIFESRIINQGTLNINNGDFRKPIHNYFDYDKNVLNSLGILNIEKGFFSGVLQEGIATINGGMFRDSYQETSLTISLYEDNIGASTTIKGGEFITYNPNEFYAIAIFNNSVTLKEDEISKYIPDGYVVKYDNAKIVTETASPFVAYTSNVKVSSQKMLDLIEEIAPNGVWTVNSYKPENPMEGQALLTALLREQVDYNTVEEVYASCDMNPEEGMIQLGESGYGIDEIREVKIVYNEPKEKDNETVNKFLAKMDKLNLDDIDEKTSYRVEDLYLINYLYNTKNGIDGSMALNFSKELIEAANGSNIYFRLYSGFGGGNPTSLYTYEGGQAAIFYQGMAYATINAGVNMNHVLYIPLDTENTTDAYINAAMKRIKEYLGTTEEIKIEVGDNFETLNYYDEYAERTITWNENGFIDETTCGSKYYNVTINGRTFKFAICRKGVKDLETPQYLASDIMSNISIKSNSTEIPLDTAITVKTVTSDEIEEKLGTSVYVAYDISLYSNAKQVNIKELSEGEFIVNIPVPEDFKGKDLVVYYVKENGEKEVYKLDEDELKKGYATFNTTHFSTYILTEKTEDTNNKENNDVEINDNKSEIENTKGESNTNTNSSNVNSQNPKTGDNIILFIGMLVISSIGIVITTKIKK